MTPVLVIVLLLCPIAAGILLARHLVGRSAAWRALTLAIIGIAALVLTYAYVGAYQGNDTLQYMLNEVWKWNILAGRLQVFPTPREYDDFSQKLLIYWALVCPALLTLFIVTAVLEYLDARSGLEILERLKKLFWK